MRGTGQNSRIAVAACILQIAKWRAKKELKRLFHFQALRAECRSFDSDAATRAPKAGALAVCRILAQEDTLKGLAGEIKIKHDYLLDAR
jgi:hypothetical protein